MFDQVVFQGIADAKGKKVAVINNRTFGKASRAGILPAIWGIFPQKAFDVRGQDARFRRLEACATIFQTRSKPYTGMESRLQPVRRPIVM